MKFNYYVYINRVGNKHKSRKIKSKFISTNQAEYTAESAGLTSLAKSTSNNKSAKGVENPQEYNYTIMMGRWGIYYYLW